MQISRAMEPRQAYKKYLIFKFKITIILLINLLTKAATNHIAAVSCSQRADCLASINEEIVATIRTHMHNATEPCENFWDYACGDWTAAPYYDHVDTFGAIGNFYRQQLSEFLEVVKSDDDTEIEHLLHKLRAYYASCRASGSYHLNMSKYIEVMPRMPGVQWPTDLEAVFTKNKHEDNFNWLAAIAQLRRYGVNDVLISEDVGFASNDSSRYVVELKMPAESQQFKSKHELEHYFEQFGWLEGPANEQERLQIAASVYELEKQLRDLRSKHIEINAPESRFTLAELQYKVGNIDWLRYFNSILDVMPPQTLPIELENIGYMHELGEFLAQTENHIISSYILLHLSKYLLAISPRITARNCVEHMEVSMALGMDYIYDHKLYQTRVQDERAIGAIFERLKMQFSKYLQQNKMQLSATELEYLQQKLLKMRWRLGNLPQVQHRSFFNDYYRDAKIDVENFFSNHWEMLRHRTHKQHVALLQGYFDPNTYFVNDDIRQVRNAPYFVHQRNLLYVPLNFAHMPFYDYRLHPLLQQSLMGWILAHEINHGFEVDGIQLDADGNESALGAAIKRHNKYHEAVQFLSRTRTASLIERMADINGFQLAYDAFFNTVEFSELLTFAAEFSAEQLYFLNFAQFFCGKLPPAIDHDRDDVRVIQILANLPEFAHVFKCAHGVQGNPQQKCQMWR